VSISRAEQDRAVLCARRSLLERELAGIDEEIAKINTYIDLARKYEEAPARGEAVNHQGSSEPNLTDDTLRGHLDERFRHKSYTSAACLALEIEGRAMSCPDITKRLIEAGIDFVAKDPERSVYSSLVAAERSGRVRRAVRGLWEIVPPDERGVGDMQAKHINPIELSEKTRLGLSRAKERGVQLGVREKMTDAQHTLAVQMISEGNSLSAVAKAVGFSSAGLSKWMARHGIERPTKGRSVTGRETDDRATSAPSGAQEPF
jgi:hypothetical protein